MAKCVWIFVLHDFVAIIWPKRRVIIVYLDDTVWEDYYDIYNSIWTDFLIFWKHLIVMDYNKMATYNFSQRQFCHAQIAANAERYDEANACHHGHRVARGHARHLRPAVLVHVSKRRPLDLIKGCRWVGSLRSVATAVRVAVHLSIALLSGLEVIEALHSRT